MTFKYRHHNAIVSSEHHHKAPLGRRGEQPTGKSQDAEVQWEERRSAKSLLSQPNGGFRKWTNVHTFRKCELI